jgi:centrosomal protein CEP135
MDSTLQTTGNSSSISEQKYVNLRKRLDQLGYRQTLGVESLPLIEKLFNDLIHTTESLKKTKLELSKSADQLNVSLKNASVTSNGDLVPASIQAYKSDNAKLIKENNELHLELIKMKDEFEAQIKGKFLT